MRASVKNYIYERFMQGAEPKRIAVEVGYSICLIRDIIKMSFNTNRMKIAKQRRDKLNSKKGLNTK